MATQRHPSIANRHREDNPPRHVHNQSNTDSSPEKPFQEAPGSSLIFPHGARTRGSASTGILRTRGCNPAGGTSSSVQGENCQDGTPRGASASNTAPSNYIEAPKHQQNPDSPDSLSPPAKSDSVQLLHVGIDSLYLSFHGKLDTEYAEKLDELKKLAQSNEPELVSDAVLSIGDHQFEVKDRGKGKFRYVLVDNWFHIQIASVSAKKLPCLYVQISSELLTLEGFHFAIDDLITMAAALTEKVDAIRVSRVDLCADFTTTHDLQPLRAYHWVTRVKQKDTYYHNNTLSGWVFGKGGQMMARMYDKTLEVEKHGKTFFHNVWKDKGWDETSQVWRIEFQLKRQALKDCIYQNTVKGLTMNLNPLWEYCTTDWLRLTIPNELDQNQTRWANHPLWSALQAINWGEWFKEEQEEFLPVRVARKTRMPSDDYLFKNGLAFLSSYMAREGITDINEGVSRYLDDARTYHQSTDKSLHQYLQEKRQLKARQYNNNKPFDPHEADRDELDGVPMPWDDDEDKQDEPH